GVAVLDGAAVDETEIDDVDPELGVDHVLHRLDDVVGADRRVRRLLIGHGILPMGRGPRGDPRWGWVPARSGIAPGPGRPVASGADEEPVVALGLESLGQLRAALLGDAAVHE